MICPACGQDNLAGLDYCSECRMDLHDLDLPKPDCKIEEAILTDPMVGLIPRDPLQVSPGTPVREVMTKMVETGRNCALVVEDGEIVGIFTERDILMELADGYQSCADSPVEQFMVPDPERVRPTDSVAHGLNRMLVGGFRHLPVERDGKALGVVSVRDILGYFCKRFPDALANRKS